MDWKYSRPQGTLTASAAPNCYMNDDSPLHHPAACRPIAAWPAVASLALVALCGAATANVPDFGVYDELLLQNVRNGFVNYDGLANDARFGEFVRQIGASAPEVLDGPDNGLAFYINAYNALAIQGVLDGGSPERKRSRRRFFERQTFQVLGEAVTLEALEKERILPLGDARVRFAIACAAMSCPRLSSRAYRPDNINVQLHDAAHRFINDPTRNRFDLDRRIAFVSMIFDWYAEDFVKAGGSLQKYLARFVADAEVQEALRAEEFEMRYVEHDWGLNGYYSRARN